MNKIEEKIYKKYKREVSRLIRNKYKKKATTEAENEKFRLKAEKNMRKSIDNLAKTLYQTYIPIIEEEIQAKLDSFIESDKFKNAVKAEHEANKKKLNYKSLKKYQEFEIGINNDLLENLYQEVNSDKSECELSKEEIKYILLCLLYKVIDYLKEGYKIKFGTIFKIWLEQRDIRVNLPNVRNRIIEDRLIPKIELCRSFGYNLFQEINKDNTPIINYYRSKIERYLMLLKVKQSNKNENN